MKSYRVVAEVTFKRRALFNTLTADDEYFRHNSKNLQLLILVQLSKKQKTFCCFFITLSESTLNFEHSEKKRNVISENSLRISEIIDSERRGYLNAQKILFLDTLPQSTWTETYLRGCSCM